MCFHPKRSSSTACKTQWWEITYTTVFRSYTAKAKQNFARRFFNCFCHCWGLKTNVRPEMARAENLWPYADLACAYSLKQAAAQAAETTLCALFKAPILILSCSTWLVFSERWLPVTLGTALSPLPPALCQTFKPQVGCRLKDHIIHEKLCKAGV